MDTSKFQRTIQVSAPFFWGYQYIVTRDKALTTPRDELVEELKKDMGRFFRSHNLMLAAEQIPSLNLHIQGDLVNDDTVYACCCCGKEE